MNNNEKSEQQLKVRRLSKSKKNYLTRQVEGVRTQDGFFHKLVESLPSNKAVQAFEFLVELMQDDYPTDVKNYDYMIAKLKYLIYLNV